MTSHLDDGTIHELIDGEIASVDLPPVQAHLAECQECRARFQSAQSMVAEADAFIEALDDDVAAGVPAPVAPSVLRPARVRTLAWAASLVVAAGLGYYSRPMTVPAVQPAAALTEEPMTPVTIGASPPAVSDAAPLANGNAPRVAAAAPERGAAQRRDGQLPPTRPTTAAIGATQSFEDAAATTSDARREATGTATGAGGLAARPGVMASPGGAAMNTRGASTERSAPAAAPAPLARRLPGEGQSVEVADPVMRQAQNALVPRDQVTTKQAITFPAVDTITFIDAVRRLGGRLMLIEGLVPIRLEAAGREVRVIYAVAGGELVLRQSVVGGGVVTSLTGPGGFPPDSLAALRRRVRE